jgi:hypothetical protein
MKAFKTSDVVVPTLTIGMKNTNRQGKIEKSKTDEYTEVE